MDAEQGDQKGNDGRRTSVGEDGSAGVPAHLPAQAHREHERRDHPRDHDQRVDPDQGREELGDLAVAEPGELTPAGLSSMVYKQMS